MMTTQQENQRSDIFNDNLGDLMDLIGTLNDELGNRTDTITLHPGNVSKYVFSTGLEEAEFEACTGKDLEIQKYLVTATEECPCGHPTTFSEIDMSRGMIMASSDNLYSDDLVTLVPTEDGYEESDPCFCDNQRENCENCMYLQILRMSPAQWNVIYGAQHDHHVKMPFYLTVERGFACEGYTLEVDTSDSEGYGDTSDYTLYCIQYSGKYKQRRQWHVLVDDDSCDFCKYRVTTGLIVPEIPRHWMRGRRLG